MKYEYAKVVDSPYKATDRPSLVMVPEQRFITIHGEGNPNGPDFADRTGVLYPIAWGIKMGFKKAHATDPNASSSSTAPFDDFTVFPLEGWWSMTGDDSTNKDAYIYDLMIGQPDFVSSEMFELARAKAADKHPNPLFGEVTFGTISGGLSVQMLHRGPYDDEPASFAKMAEFCAASGLQRLTPEHREIYLGDPRKTAPEKLRTILRFTVR
ncbi:MAG: GyrI-like domain-containing protein [Propionibacteriaceae bacterium]|jgi:hypothetical protein|nr:GyrI-like domain-containing protein [Propionibacteriaceae bacterium]